LSCGIGDHFLPLADPAHGAREREDRREHRGREAHRVEDDAGIEIDVRVELLLGEIGIFQGDLLQLLGDLQGRVVLDAQKVQHLVGDCFITFARGSKFL
jgi:hypothetical protein